MMEEADQKHNLHIDLLTKLIETFSLQMDSLGTFRLKLRKYLPYATIQGATNLVDIFDAMENKGFLAIGRYNALKDLFTNINESLVTLITTCEQEMKNLDTGHTNKDVNQVECEGRTEQIGTVFDVWKDFSAEITFYFQTNKESTTNALQSFAVDKCLHDSIYPRIHAILECFDSERSIKLRAASPLFYEYCCSKESIESAFENMKASLLKEICMFPWLDPKLTNIRVKLLYKKEGLTSNTDTDVSSIPNNLYDFRHWVMKEVDLLDMKDYLAQRDDLIDKSELDKMTRIDDLIEYFYPHKEDIFRRALHDSGYIGIKLKFDDIKINKAYKIYIAILNNFDKVISLELDRLGESSTSLTKCIESMKLKDTKMLLKEVLSDTSILHAFILALNNASHTCEYDEVFKTLKNESSFEDKDFLSSHSSFKNIDGSIEKSFEMKLQKPKAGMPPKYVALRRRDEMNIRRNYSTLVKCSVVSITDELVNQGIISPLAKLLIYYETSKTIKMDTILKFLLRSDSEKFDKFQNILLHSRRLDHQKIANVLRNAVKEEENGTGIESTQIRAESACPRAGHEISDEKGEEYVRDDGSTETQTESDFSMADRHTKHIDGIKKYLRKNWCSAIYMTENLENEFVHPLFEEDIISIDEHDQVLYAEGNRCQNMKLPIIRSADKACKQDKWVKKYEELVKALQTNVPLEVKEKIEYWEVNVTTIKTREIYLNGEQAEGGCEVEIKDCDLSKTPNGVNLLRSVAERYNGVPERIGQGSINVIIKSPSPLFYNQIKSDCESEVIKQLLFDIMTTCCKDNPLLSKCAEVKIDVIYRRDDYVEKDEMTTVGMSTRQSKKLYGCCNILSNEVFISDIEHSLLDCHVCDIDTLERIVHSDTTNAEKMEALIMHVKEKCKAEEEKEGNEIFNNFIKALKTSGYKGIAKILDGSYTKHLLSIPKYKVRMCILDKYNMLVEELDMKVLKMVSDKLRDVIEKIQRDIQTTEQNCIHFLIKALVLDNADILYEFIDALSYHIKHHHILKTFQDAVLLHKEMTISDVDKRYIFRGELQMSKLGKGTSIKRKDGTAQNIPRQKIKSVETGKGTSIKRKDGTAQNIPRQKIKSVETDPTRAISGDSHMHAIGHTFINTDSVESDKNVMKRGGILIYSGNSCAPSDLLKAADCGHRDVVEELLKYTEVDISCFDKGGNNILHHCAKRGWTDILQDVLTRVVDNADRGQMLNQKSRYNKQTPILTAACHRNKEIVEILMKYKEVDIKYTDYYGQNILHYFAKDGRIDIIQHVLTSLDSRDRGQMLNQKDDTDKTVILTSAAHGNKELVEILMKYKELDMKCTNRCGENILHYCADKEWIDTLQDVLTRVSDSTDRGQMLNQKGKDKQTVILKAVYHRNKEIVEILMKYKEVDIKCTDMNCYNILHYCAKHGWTDVLQHVLTRVVDSRDRGQMLNKKSGLIANLTVILTAAYHRKKEIVEMLMNYKEIDIKCTDMWGSNILYYCAEHGWIDILQDVLTRVDSTDRGQMLNQKGKDKQTVILKAAKHRNKEIVEMLMKYKEVDIKCFDYGGHDIRYYCTQNGWTDIKRNVMLI